MIKLLSLVLVIAFSNPAQAIIFGCKHGGTNCKTTNSAPLKTYDCWGSGAEDPEIRLVKKNSDIDDGTVNLFTLDNFLANSLSDFKEMAVPGTVGSIENLDLLSETPVCNSEESNCLQIKKGSLGSDSAAFVLVVDESAFGSMSFVCKATN